ncbi:MAG: hypothetical protein HY904_08585 [Deltaproteobacteria bacterium]|nr:hypothetical protein [Deltaproteobacteria bacterium]
MEATFSWYFRDEDRWLTVDSRQGRVGITPGLADRAEMKFYSSCVADFIHQHATEGAGRAIFQGGGFYWRGDINRLKEISPLCKTLFGPRLHQRLVGAGITVPKFEVRRYPARTKAQRDRILAEWMMQGERPNHRVASTPPTRAELAKSAKETRVVTRATKTARTVKAAKTVKAAVAHPVRHTRAAATSDRVPKIVRKA